MQDHYRQQPPPSPAHGPYQQHPPYPPPRDGIVKREAPYDEHSRRSSSTGHVLEGAPAVQPVPTHQHHNQLPPYADSQTRHMNYDHGPPSVPPTPGGYRTSAYPPPTPIGQYEHPSYPAEPYYNVYSSSSKKKNTRASQACDNCRSLKAKCDETKPCKTCKDKNVECRYRDPIPKATDKAQADILEGLSRLETILQSQGTILQTQGNMLQTQGNMLQTQGTDLTEMSRRLHKLESAYGRMPPVPVKPEPIIEDDHKVHGSPQTNSNTTSEHYSVSEASRDVAASTETAPSETTLHPGHGPEHYHHNESSQLQVVAEDEVERDPGPPVPPGEPAIPINHTTLAGLLLEWASIKELTSKHLLKEGVRFISEYPISIEQSRGALILYGRGEDAHHQIIPRETPDHGTVEAPDDMSDITSPSPAPDYGQLGGLSPPEQVEYRGGVLTADGNPDFSEGQVWRYVESFRENILNMHPIIQNKVLDQWTRQFLDSLAPAHTKPQWTPASKAAFAVENQQETAGMKRKRSPEPDISEADKAKPTRPNRSTHSALMLTILALGKVCQYRNRIPDALHVPESLPHGSPRNPVTASPAQGSPMGPNPYGPSPHGEGSARRASAQANAKSGLGLKKNYDVIPGLEYFAYATDILGNQLGAYNNMKNVYANIFASLYYGQLERSMQSYAHINIASNKLLVILRPSMDKLRRLMTANAMPTETKYNQLCLAFWTCLQLESDIIAELPLPPSGLLSYEDDMPRPDMRLLDHPPRVADSYNAQLYLRKHLNSIHRMFYAPTDPSKENHNERFRNVELVAESVSSMSWVSPRFRFEETDPPANELLAARLRAKYWGAQMITYRPFIRQILNFSYSMRMNPSSPNLPSGTEFRKEVDAPIIDPNARSSSDIDPAIIELAKKAIKALVESTRAFHNLDEVGNKRPIITNVYGTAHAQWGNLLVLTACWQNTILRPHVDGNLLQYLYKRTIRFLQQSATATSSLKIDLNILKGLYQDFWPEDHPTGSSFSSHSSVATPMGPPHVPH
jgi:hypothetical protein